MLYHICENHGLTQKLIFIEEFSLGHFCHFCNIANAAVLCLSLLFPGTVAARCTPLATLDTFPVFFCPCEPSQSHKEDLWLVAAATGKQLIVHRCTGRSRVSLVVLPRPPVDHSSLPSSGICGPPSLVSLALPAFSEPRETPTARCQCIRQPAVELLNAYTCLAL